MTSEKNNSPECTCLHRHVTKQGGDESRVNLVLRLKLSQQRFVNFSFSRKHFQVFAIETRDFKLLFSSNS